MKRLKLNLDLTGIIILIAVGVMVPVLLATAAGIVALAIADDAGGIVTGVLVVSFAVTAMGSALIAVLLASRKLHLARRQADFLSGMSHEFRTPLSAIRLYAQTLQSGKLANDADETQRCLDTILRETEWLDATIDRVLTWRSSARDALPLECVHAPVTKALEHAATRFRSMVPPDGLSFRCTLQSTLAIAHDPRALTTVVLNLLINAFKYTDAEKEIALSVVDAGELIVISVADNGIGLSASEARHVFQPFYRVQRSGDESRGGSGLGLAIAHHLVRQQKGSIRVESEPGHGASFVIEFPVLEESA